MNVEIGAEAALFPEKEFINGIAVAVKHEIFGSRVFMLSKPVRIGDLGRQ
jgi:hypothetical protein